MATSVPWARIVGATMPEADREEALVGDVELRLQGVVGPLVGGRELAAAVLLGPGDPAEAVVEALGPPRLGLGQRRQLGLPVALLEHRHLVGALAPDEALLVVLLVGVGLEEVGDLGLELFDADHPTDGTEAGRRYRATSSTRAVASGGVSDRCRPQHESASRRPRHGERQPSTSSTSVVPTTDVGTTSADTLRWRRRVATWTRPVTRAKGGRTTSHGRRADRLVTHHRRHTDQFNGSPSHGRPWS